MTRDERVTFNDLHKSAAGSSADDGCSIEGIEKRKRTEARRRSRLASGRSVRYLFVAAAAALGPVSHAFHSPLGLAPCERISLISTELSMVAFVGDTSWSYGYDDDFYGESDRPMGDKEQKELLENAVQNAESLVRPKKKRRRYKRKRALPATETRAYEERQQRKKEYEQIKIDAEGPPSIWSFESLFPSPVLDEAAVQRDLYEVKERDALRGPPSRWKSKGAASTESAKKQKPNIFQAMRQTLSPQTTKGGVVDRAVKNPLAKASVSRSASSATSQTGKNAFAYSTGMEEVGVNATVNAFADEKPSNRVDDAMTRLVEDRIYGYRRSPSGTFEYETSLMGDGAVQFRDGVRLGNPLKINANLLTYYGRKELSHNRLEEAQEFYEQALSIDPRDGRPYLGLSKIAERRRDFSLARQCLRAGIAQSFAPPVDKEGTPDRGANPFLLQALGVLEEKMGNVNEADTLYRSAVRSRPTHAAAWVSLGKLRTKKLRQSVAAARQCYQSAERELARAGLPQSSHVYTAWGMLEYKQAGDVRRARELFKNALEIDPRCSVAWLQLGLIEAGRESYKNAENCFESVLKFDKRNSRVLQAYAIMETKRPGGISRKAIDLFERALKAKPRDAGVLQAYALYVADLGDIDSARNLLRTGTEINKRHAPVWQAWGVLETRYGSPEVARDVFQQGIWACAQAAVGQSGGYKCARLWQAWGVLEAREQEYAAARRCFSRALDADSRNVAAFTAWASMEEEIGNLIDARSIFERGLSQFKAGSDQKTSLWRSYEMMEKRTGNMKEAMSVYQRAMRETMLNDMEDYYEAASRPVIKTKPKSENKKPVRRSDDEFEVYEFGDSYDTMTAEVWFNEGSLESKVPDEVMRQMARKQQDRRAATAAQANNSTEKFS